MTSEAGKTLYRRYQLESELLHLEQRKAWLDKSLPEAKYALREAQSAVLEYEGFTFRGIRDKLTGKWEDQHDALQRQAKHAETELQSVQQELTALERKLTTALTQLEPLRAMGDPLDCAENLEPAERERIVLLEARLSTKKLIPALEETETALEHAQEWARPFSRVEAVPGYTKNMYYSEADQWARKSYECLERIAKCGILLEIHPYFTNPVGYIVGVAAEYAQLDRINGALLAVWEAKKQAQELLAQLPEEEF